MRETQARETRRRVIDSARDLFLEQGYPATAIAAVARRAGVSADTIYSTFGTKGALLKEVLAVVIGGDDAESALLDQADPQAMRAEPDQRRQLAMFAAGLTRQLERIRPVDDILRSAAAVDPVAADLRADLQLRQRRQSMCTVVPGSPPAGRYATHCPSWTPSWSGRSPPPRYIRCCATPGTGHRSATSNGFARS